MNRTKIKDQPNFNFSNNPTNNFVNNSNSNQSNPAATVQNVYNSRIF